MDGWMDIRTDGRTDGSTDGQTVGWTNIRMKGRSSDERSTGRWSDERTDEKSNGRMLGRMALDDQSTAADDRSNDPLSGTMMDDPSGDKRITKSPMVVHSLSRQSHFRSSRLNPHTHELKDRKTTKSHLPSAPVRAPIRLSMHRHSI